MAMKVLIHFIHGTNKLYAILALLFTSFLLHGYSHDYDIRYNNYSSKRFRLDYSYERTIFSVVFGITIWFQKGTRNNAMHLQRLLTIIILITLLCYC